MFDSLTVSIFKLTFWPVDILLFKKNYEFCKSEEQNLRNEVGKQEEWQGRQGRSGRQEKREEGRGRSGLQIGNLWGDRRRTKQRDERAVATQTLDLPLLSRWLLLDSTFAVTCHFQLPSGQWSRRILHEQRRGAVGGTPSLLLELFWFPENPGGNGGRKSGLCRTGSAGGESSKWQIPWRSYWTLIWLCLSFALGSVSSRSGRA